MLSTGVGEMKQPDETYLGDGLYASFDGYNIALRAPREHDDHIVYLEPNVFQALIAFVDDLKKARGGTP